MNKYLTQRWKTEPCNSGEECWCRVIIPEHPEEEGDYIVHAATVPKELAEYIVDLHNMNIGAPFYCQSQIERDDCCKEQCDHCNIYYKPLEEE